MYYGFNSDVMEHLWHTKYMGHTEIMSLDSVGNLRIIGDFRPGNQPGTVGQVPIWSHKALTIPLSGLPFLQELMIRIWRLRAFRYFAHYWD